MSNRAILLPKWRRRLRRLGGASVVLGITYLLLRAYSNWNDPDRDYKLVNFAAAWFPFAISVFVAFIPDFEKAKRMRPVWRIGIILVGLVYSVVLWVQQSVNLRAGRKDQQEAIMKAVNQANEHTDKETAERMSKLPSDVADAIVLRMSPKPTKGKIEIPSTASTTATASTADDRKSAPPQNTTQKSAPDEIAKGLQEIKTLLVGQRWGLSEAQLISLSQKLAPYVPRRERGDLITSVLGDLDSTRFATVLVASFRNAGWKLPGSGYNQAVFTGLVEGIIIKLHSKDSNPPGLVEFVSVLRQAGIEPVGEISDMIPADEFQIIVGTRPNR